MPNILPLDVANISFIFSLCQYFFSCNDFNAPKTYNEFCPHAGNTIVVISENNNLEKRLKELEESDKKTIKSLIKKKTIKDIVNKIFYGKKISKKLIYNYCIKIKNEK